MTPKQELLILTYMNLSDWMQKLDQETISPQKIASIILFNLGDVVRAIGWGDDQEQFHLDMETAYERVYGEGEA